MPRIIEQVRFSKPIVHKLTNVAAYARVSSGKDEMLHSLAAQVDYYKDYIQSNPGWLFAGVYADEALTGTKSNRADFLRMLEDCRSGKIDRVLTKSISRFARNTVTLLETVRELKSLGIDVYFEEQNIHSMSSDGELMLTILASYCGGFFGPKVWNSNSKYRRVIWQCNNKFKGEKCRTPHLDEKDIYRKFLQAYNLLLLHREQLRRDCEEMLRFLTDNTNLEAELETLRNEQEVVAELTRKLVNENASTARRQVDYYEKYTSLVDRYEELGEQIVVLEQKCLEREQRAKEIQSFLQTVVSEKGELTQFDPRVWVEVIDQVTVFHDGRVVFRFKDGREIAT